MISILNAQIKPARRSKNHIVSSLSWALLIIGGVALTYAVYAVSDTAAYQQVELHKLESPNGASRVNFTTAQVMLNRPIIGEVIGELQVPRIGLRTIVVEGDSAKILRRAVGHIPSTAFPGQDGNIALAGHRDSLFLPLQQIQQGDLVTFDSLGQQFQYEVFATQIVSPDDVGVLHATAGHELTLITCFPFGFIGPAPKRFIVRAREIETRSLATFH
ncbi:MAG TPA: class D sortase [Terriglobales bacterium]|nr:class D sortase [Terriglobales bacterium]